jgi:hypothetical protein
MYVVDVTGLSELADDDYSGRVVYEFNSAYERGRH